MRPLRILLLQARRRDDSARLDERRSFARRAGLDESSFVLFDLLSAAPTVAEVRRYDCLMVGGSGDYYVSKGNLPYYEPLLEILRETAAIGHPTFASCFGFQLLVQALGGEIVYDPANMEVGTFPLTLTPAGRLDELFGALPEVFNGQLGHKDRAARMPPGVVNLAASRRAPYQALRVPGQPVWATQFHPELSREENLKRFRQYKAGYMGVMSTDEIARTMAAFDHSPETDALIRRFLDLVFG